MKILLLILLSSAVSVSVSANDYDTLTIEPIEAVAAFKSAERMRVKYVKRTQDGGLKVKGYLFSDDGAYRTKSVCYAKQLPVTIVGCKD